MQLLWQAMDDTIATGAERRCGGTSSAGGADANQSRQSLAALRLGCGRLSRNGTLLAMQQQEPTLDQYLAMVAKILSEMPKPDRLLYLAHLEQKARREGDLHKLRVLREYRRRL